MSASKNLPRSMWLPIVVLALVGQLISSSSTPPEIVLVKVGGSSITDKANFETLNEDSLEWFARIVAESSIQQRFVIVHGAGSFGHHTAKEYDLRGKTVSPRNKTNAMFNAHLVTGVARTRLSVQKLNQAVVSAFLEHDVPAVGISPCFGVPGVQAHGGDDTARQHLVAIVQSTVAAGLVPVLHGDACLYGTGNVGILSGDTIMEILGQATFITRAVFLTDVDGVYTADPNTNPSAELLPVLYVDRSTSDVVSAVALNAAASTHEHDVTGGLKVHAGILNHT